MKKILTVILCVLGALWWLGKCGADGSIDSVESPYGTYVGTDNTDYIFEDEPKPANNEIWYTATVRVEPTNPEAFGATYVSNEWDSETGKGVITFDGDVTKIESCAFRYCHSLTSVTIGDSVTTIGDYAFHDCTSLTSVTIGDSVTTIGWCAFCDCSSLTSVTIGNSVTTIGNYAFNGCKSLKEFKGKFAADNGRCLIKDNTLIAYAEASGTTYTIPDSVTTIGEGAFQDCTRLTSVTIGNSVTTIGGSAFAYCSSLKEFMGKFAADGGRCLIMDNTLIAYAEASGTTYTIPDSVTTIGNSVFNSCTSLTSVTIPDSVTTIGDYAFYGCNSLKTVYCKPTTPPTGGVDMFSYYDDDGDDKPIGCKIYVPASDNDSIIKAYKAKGYWSNYKNYIFESSSL